jgi:UBX domain-containing protein 1
MSSGAPANRDDQIAQLAGLTGVPPAEASASKLLETRTVKQHADYLQAERYLDAANGDLQVAAELFYEQSGEAEADQASDTEMAGDDQPANPPSEQQRQQQQQPVPGGGRTLGGAYVPPTEASSSSSSRAQSTQPKAPQQRGVAGLRTLKDLQSSGGGHGHAHDDDDSGDDDKDDENQDFFAGGEKSGLAVQNPNQANPRDHINNILKRARQ